MKGRKRTQMHAAQERNAAVIDDVRGHRIARDEQFGHRRLVDVPLLVREEFTERHAGRGGLHPWRGVFVRHIAPAVAARYRL